jgi:hypothetical protein
VTLVGVSIVLTSAVSTKGVTMSVNILATIMNNVSPEMLARISSMLGIDRMVTEKTMNAAIPAILAGLARMLGKPDGANQLSNVLNNTQSSNLLEGLASMVGGSGKQAVVSAGTGLLSSLLGSGGMRGITDAISQFSGVEPAQANSLAGVAGLLTANGLNKVRKENGLDTAGLARMVSQQAPQFAAAMPSGFSNMLRGAADTFQSEPASTTYTAPAEDLRRTTGATYQPTSRTTSPSPSWMYWALGLLALLGLGWLLTSMDRNREVASTAPPVATQTPGAAGGTTTQPIVAIGSPIYSSDGERLGEVTEIVMGPNNLLESVRLDMGAPLGIGPRIVTMRADQFERKGDRVTSKMTAADARNLPSTPK